MRKLNSMKTWILAFVLTCICVSSGYCYEKKMYEIDADKYCPGFMKDQQNLPTTITNSDGTKTLIVPSPIPGQGTIYHSDGSKSIYHR